MARVSRQLGDEQLVSPIRDVIVLEQENDEAHYRLWLVLVVDHKLLDRLEQDLLFDGIVAVGLHPRHHILLDLNRFFDLVLDHQSLQLV